MDSYVGVGIEKKQLVAKLSSSVKPTEALEGTIKAKVGPFERLVIVTDQRVIHLLPATYEVVESIHRPCIDYTNRYLDGPVHKLDIHTSRDFYSYASSNAVDLMWFERILDEAPEDVDEGKSHEHEIGALLVVCRVCGGKVSRTARSCPHCGEPRFSNVRTKEKSGKGSKIERTQRTMSESISGGIAIMGLGGILSLFGIGAIIGIPMLFYGMFKMVVPGKKRHTVCPNCGADMDLESYALYAAELTNGVNCKACSERLIEKEGYMVRARKDK